APMENIQHAYNTIARDFSKYTWKVYCFNRDTGKLIWERTAHEGIPRSDRSTKNSGATSTPATDGRHLVVWFGSEGLYDYDMDGKLLWKQDLGVLKNGWVQDETLEYGVASSPIIYKNLAILQVDLFHNSFIAAFDVETGKQVWKTAREGMT